MSNKETITIDGIKYIKESAATGKSLALPVDGLKCVMVRTYSAGVHFGYLKKHTGKEVVLLNSRRVWYWDGAASLSQLAIDGTSSPDKCKFPCAVPEITLTEAIEIIPITKEAKESLYGIKEWKG